MSGGKASGNKLREASDAEAALLALYSTHRQSSLLLVMAARQGATDAQVADALRKGLPAHLTGQSSLDLMTRDTMSSWPAAGDKRSALDAPDTSDDDGCQRRGKEAGAAGPQLEEAEMRNKKLRRDGEARNVSQEERKMRAIIAADRGHGAQGEGGQGWCLVN